MLKLKLQYFDHLMRRADSFEKILMLGKTEGRRSRGSMGSHTFRHDRSDLTCIHALENEMAIHFSVLAWRIPGTEELGGLLSTGSHTVRQD